ncbi:MAG: creatininase family protein [Candidatus Thermoplasmatota archaeon]|nr:creatininase family protein [Euryarchaeota archaeon]MBU4031730.1 creatininase family protein [Candidatus Thermoplasmatota archaeon]MBU4071329.1 creatininase family protein [Candidatus Thermoplasmatota archaeon]MBU4144453.1 creatininase family protein [Candidatus Thermoplasmatota archaeon]MBU4592315.1 creatininase family protein [Candidatus Thermoplasmatota archaeon]
MNETILFEELTSKEVGTGIDKNSVAIFPIGALEEHGPHLPLSTDNLQPEYVAIEVAKKLGNTFVLPILKYGQCSSTRNFPGTVSLRFETLQMIAEDVLTELHRTGFRNVVVLSGHAGRLHMAALKLAAGHVLEKLDMKLMVLSDYDIAYAMKEIEIPPDDGHAGMIETSRVMAIRPDLVKGSAEPCHPEFPKYRVMRDAQKYFPDGVMGDPQLANKEFGEKANGIIIDELVDIIRMMVDE